MKKIKNGRKVTRRKFIKTSLSGVGMLALASSFGVPKLLAAKPPIKIGVLFMLTGMASATGNEGKNGCLVWQKMHPEGILGRPVELIFRDEGRTDNAVAKFKEFAEVDKVDFVMGINSSGTALALLPFAAKYKKILINTASKTDRANGVDFPKSDGYHFRPVCMDSVAMARAQCVLIKKVHPDAKSILCFGPDYAWGYDVVSRSTPWLKENWPNIKIMDPIYHPLGERNYLPYISKMMELKPDVVIGSIWADDETTFIRQAVPFKFFEKIHFSPITLNLPELATLGKLGPEGIWGSPCTYWFQAPDSSEKRKIMGVWRSLGYPYPGWCGQEAYAGLEFIKAGIEKAGTVETEAVKRTFEGLEYWNPMFGRKILVRAFDHQAMAPLLVGQLKYDPDLGFCVYDKKTWMWIEAENLYLTEKETRALWAK
jgi:branched-chain amino acid transport system substrate-binding protein